MWDAVSACIPHALSNCEIGGSSGCELDWRIASAFPTDTVASRESGAWMAGPQPWSGALCWPRDVAMTPRASIVEPAFIDLIAGLL